MVMAAVQSVPSFDWDAYGRAVMAGQRPVCKWTRLAVERHYRDLKDGRLRGLWFSEDHAQHALESFLVYRHSKGEWAGQPFELAPWQQFILWSLFGWRRADGLRRFRTAFVAVPRKNGKTTLYDGSICGSHLNQNTITFCISVSIFD
jgi:phage terminase large subunit-like protein